MERVVEFVYLPALGVTQVSNLCTQKAFRAGRRTSSLRVVQVHICSRFVGSPADWKSASSPESFRGTQVGNLRYAEQMRAVMLGQVRPMPRRPARIKPSA